MKSAGKATVVSSRTLAHLPFTEKTGLRARRRTGLLRSQLRFLYTRKYGIKHLVAVKCSSSIRSIEATKRIKMIRMR